MIITVIVICTILLLIMTFVGLFRAYVGPTAADRMVAINMITTKVTTIIVMIALVTAQELYVSVALVYALIGFVTTIGVSRYLMKGKLD
ncbi:MAG: monovalent cation/H+ antiporter complex subunit F [Acholeplasmataceae bacterium]|nr:monovalent cation/H+ antiporter complex subunit F [Acholeplasmataceae bacterium]MDD4194471.1 monovalent cation/H+ antiporter complex subunit F [Acholeplasmataceae bacterium]